MRKKVIIFITSIFMSLGFTIYAYSPAYFAEPFLSIPLSDPQAPINDIFYMHYPHRAVLVRAPNTVDGQGRIYIVGSKNGRVRVVVVNKQGKIKRVITPRLKDGRFLERCPHISVSPSGNRIWTIEWDRNIKGVVHRITVHDRNGKAIMDWLISGHPSVYWQLTVHSENAAFVLVCDPPIGFCFIIGQEKPQQFKVPEFTFCPFFHNDRYWYIGYMEELSRYLRIYLRKNKIKDNQKKQWLGIMTWMPFGEAQIVAQFEKKRFEEKGFEYPIIHWIDENGNFYCYFGKSLKNPIWTFLTKIKIFEKILQILGFSDHFVKLSKTITIFSSKGRVLETIPPPAVIVPAKGEELQYGHLVKADRTGIYLEVERVNEPREYRIVRIVKKRRWQVWWERLIQRTKR